MTTRRDRTEIRKSRTKSLFFRGTLSAKDKVVEPEVRVSLAQFEEGAGKHAGMREMAKRVNKEVPRLPVQSGSAPYLPRVVARVSHSSPGKKRNGEELPEGT
jgi:hypothetical protein